MLFSQRQETECIVSEAFFSLLASRDIQAYLGGIVVFILDHHNKPSHNLFADGEFCLQFVKM